MEANGERFDPVQINTALGGAFERGLNAQAAAKPAVQAPAPPAPPPADTATTEPANNAGTSDDQAEADADASYHARLAPYREFKVRVAAADGTPACDLPIGDLIDRYQNEGAEIRIDPNHKSYLKMQVIRHTAGGTSTTRPQFTLVGDPGQGWQLTTIIADGASAPLYSSSAVKFTVTSDAYFINAFRLSAMNRP